MSEPVRFLLNGTLVEVDGLAPQTTLWYGWLTMETLWWNDQGLRAQRRTDHPFAATIRVGGVA